MSRKKTKKAAKKPKVAPKVQSKWTVEVIPLAQKEIGALSDDLQAHFIRVSELLEEFGPNKVSRPHVKHLRDKLWEMRFKGKDGIARAIYFTTTGKRIVVVRAFVKKTEKTPNREMNLAEKRMKELKNG